MSTRAEIAASAAAASLSILQELGEMISYTRIGSAAVTVYGLVTGGDVTVMESGASRSVDVIEVFIPLQQGFPPVGGVQLYDTIVYDSKTFLIEGIDVDSLNAAHKIRAVLRTLNV